MSKTVRAHTVVVVLLLLIGGGNATSGPLHDSDSARTDSLQNLGYVVLDSPYTRIDFDNLGDLHDDIEAKCPLEGSAGVDEPEKQEVLRAKNSFRPAVSYRYVPLDSFFIDTPDTHRFSVGDSVYTEGYLFRKSNGGPEACNCNVDRVLMKDMRLYLALDRGQLLNIVCEVNARTKILWDELLDRPITDGAFEDEYAFKNTGMKVRVYGILFWDALHTKDARNTSETFDPHKDKVPRASAWELHPVFEIEKID